MAKRKIPEVLAIVPARGGSKTIPKKNILPIAGYPLIAYSIAAGLQAKSVTRLIVSTDSEEIAEIARSYGAEIPFLRPARFAGDDSLDIELFKHALEWLNENEGYRPDIIAQLRPTSPIRPKGLIDDAVQKMVETPEADCVRAVTFPEQTPYKMWREGEGGFMEPLLESEYKEPYNMPRQMLPDVLWQPGNIDVIRYETIMEKNSMAGERLLPVFIDPVHAIDIDTRFSFRYAEELLGDESMSIVRPDKPPSVQREDRKLVDDAELIVFDFDGVFTDNKVLVDQNGVEAVVCDRGDGMGLAMLREKGIAVMVLSTEVNPVVLARCGKLGIPCVQGLENKGKALEDIAGQRGLDLAKVVYVGNDVNDLGCFEIVGCSVAVADSHALVLEKADIILSKPGGNGAVRELCDMLTGMDI